VEGTLDAVGNATDPIIFTSINDNSVGGDTGSGDPVAGDWNGITTPYSIANNEYQQTGSVDLAHVDVSYSTTGFSSSQFGGGPGTVSITESRFSDYQSQAIELVVNSANPAPVIEDDYFDGSAGGAIYLDGSNIDLDEVTGNTGSAAASVFVRGSVATTTWGENAIPLTFTNLDVPTGATLNIVPGSVVKGLYLAALTVEGTLDAVGNATDPIIFTSINDNSVGGDTGSGDPVAGDWNGIQLSAEQVSSGFSYDVFENASAAIQVSLLDVLQVSYSVFSSDDAAITVQSTANDDPVLGALSCVPPYLSVIDASTDWFGSTGYPAPSIDLLGLLGGVVPSDFSSLYGAISTYGSAEVGLSDDTVPWSIYTCPALFDFPIPVTAVIFNAVPSYPLVNSAYRE
jgi:hypothetical protein